jgi:hypothetical protein
MCLHRDATDGEDDGGLPVHEMQIHIDSEISHRYCKEKYKVERLARSL